MAGVRPPIWMVLKAHFTRNPSKTAVLAVLCVMMVVVYGRMFWSGPSQSVEADVMIGAIEGTAGTPAGDVSAVAASGVSLERTPVTQPLTRELPKDPFQAAVPGANAVPDETTASAYLSPYERELIGASLELQGTSCGEDPIAAINGHVLRPGEEIDGFTLERVEPTRAWLRKDGNPVVLTLK